MVSNLPCAPGGGGNVLAMIKSGTILGIQGQSVRVEVHISSGLPFFDLVGLPDAAVREARQRVRSAIKNTGLEFPLGRITLNLAPAHLRKGGPHFDLPLAAGILSASGQLGARDLDPYLLWGELSLDGSLQGVAGSLALSLLARELGCRGVLVPRDNLAEAALVEGLEVIPFGHLGQFIAWTHGRPGWQTAADPPGNGNPAGHRGFTAHQGASNLDLKDIKGQQGAQRALEIAAAGGHNVLMVGPPGTGKTMLAMRLPTIMPALEPTVSMEVSRIYSVAGLLSGQPGLIGDPPFRAPHHSIPRAALIGGGNPPRPGEVTLAHAGVLFLDELAEFRREVLESLRQPLESGSVTISRLGNAAEFPAAFLLAAAMNPCPCGYLGDPERPCTCRVRDILSYRRRASGPLLDRFDLHVVVPRIAFGSLHQPAASEASATVRHRVERARSRQQQRQHRHRHREDGSPLVNARLGGDLLEAYCGLDAGGLKILEESYRKLRLSVRAHDRILRVARTIADLEGEEQIKPHHISEAVQLRDLDRTLAVPG